MNRITRRLTDWEKWPFKLIYAPLGFAWMYYALRTRAFWFFSNVNPTLEFSGFEGEGKKEMYAQLPTDLVPLTLHIHSGQPIAEVLQQLAQKQIPYPLIIKPERGMQGILVRKVHDEAELQHYHAIFQFDYIIQEYVDLPEEYSVFHIRYPGQKKGMVTGLILKEYMMVVGDGTSTLLQLIQKHPKAAERMDELMSKHQSHFHDVLPAGYKYYLSITGNHNRGARFINLHNEIDEKLTNVFDSISLHAGEFYFGRYDLKCSSLQDLKQGRNIKILEYNGTGAEPNHIYDCGMSYFSALKEIASHWKHIYRISMINKKRGVQHWGFWKGHRYLKNAGKFFAVIREYDKKF